MQAMKPDNTKEQAIKDRFLSVTVRIYVQEEDAVLALEKLIEDVETVLEKNSGLVYYDNRDQKQAVNKSLSSVLILTKVC